MTMEPTTKPEPADLERALKLIKVGILKQARARGWCGEYEDWANEMNEKIGFDVFGVRIRRKHISWTVDLTFRGTEQDISEMIDEFMNYLGAFEPSHGIEACVRFGPYGINSDVADNPDDNEGYVEDGCNCAECRMTRVQR